MGLAFSPSGCLVVQIALSLEVSKVSDDEVMMTVRRAMTGHIKSAARDMYANFVVQKIIKHLKKETIANFVKLEGLRSDAWSLAQDMTGCRCLARLLESDLAHEPAVIDLMEHMMSSRLADLCTDQYGYIVICLILQL